MRRGEEEGAREKKFKKNAFKHHFSVIIRVRWSNVFDLVFYVCWLNIFKWNRLLVPCLHVLSSHFSLSLSLFPHPYETYLKLVALQQQQNGVHRKRFGSVIILVHFKINFSQTTNKILSSTPNILETKQYKKSENFFSSCGFILFNSILFQVFLLVVHFIVSVYSFSYVSYVDCIIEAFHIDYMHFSFSASHFP